MNAETILNAAIGVLQQRGRCTGEFVVQDGTVDTLGAMAVAAGMEPQIWQGLQELPAIQIVGRDAVLVGAARVLAGLVAPLQDTATMPVGRLVSLLGDWSDLSSLAEIYDALTKAAHLAQQAGDAA